MSRSARRVVTAVLLLVGLAVLGTSAVGAAPIAVTFTGPATATTGESVTFTAGNGLCVAPQACSWTVDGSPAGTGGATLTRAFATAGTYIVGLDVAGPGADDAGHGETSLVVSAPPPPRPNGDPKISVGVHVSGLSASFSAETTDPEGDVVTVTWNFGDATPTRTGADVTHTYAAAGTYTASATAADGHGGTATARKTFTVQASPPPVNQPPTISFTSSTSGLTASFGAAARDPEDGAVTVTWNFGDGKTATGARPTHTYATGGTYTVTATATDAAGKTGSATGQVTVTSPPPPPPPVDQPPTISFTSTTSGLGASFAAAARDPEGGPVTVTWNFGDGATGTGARSTHTYATGGTYTVTATAHDTGGKTSSDSDSVTVTSPPAPTNHAPTISFAFLTSDRSASFAATTGDVDGDAVTVTWQFGDGSTAAGTQPTHRFTKAGTYSVTATARDTGGATGTAKASVTVVDPTPGETPVPAPTPGAPATSTTPPAAGIPATGFSTTSTAVGTPIPAAPTATPGMRRMSPFPVVRVAGRFAGRATVLTVVSVRAAGSARIVVRCSGRGCPYASRTYRRTRMPSGRVRTLEGRRLQPGAVLDIRVLQTQRIGKRTVLRFAARQAPRRSDGCVTPAGRAVRCPS